MYFRVSPVDRSGYLRLLPHNLHYTDHLLQFLPVYICAGTQLHHVCGSGVFRDLSQIISIGLQIGMWATPILWNLDALSPEWIMILKLNPLVYIVNGYRSAIYEKEWFFQDFFSTMYFWIVTVVLFGLGAVIFKRLKVHFADVL